MVNGDSVYVDNLTYDCGKVIVNKNASNEISFISETDDGYFVEQNGNISYLSLLKGNIKLSEDVILVKNGRIYEGLKHVTGWIDEKGLVGSIEEATITVSNGEIVKIEIEKVGLELIKEQEKDINKNSKIKKIA